MCSNGSHKFIGHTFEDNAAIGYFACSHGRFLTDCRHNKPHNEQDKTAQANQTFRGGVLLPRLPQTTDDGKKQNGDEYHRGETKPGHQSPP
jgi:hypothetical protein